MRVTVEVNPAPDGTAIVRRRFQTPAGDLTDVRTVARPGNASGFASVSEAPVKSRADFEKVRFLLAPPGDAYIGEVPLLREAMQDKGLLVVRATQGTDQFLMDVSGSRKLGQVEC